jgi:lysophospholipase L1-like esterase
MTGERRSILPWLLAASLTLDAAGAVFAQGVLPIRPEGTRASGKIAASNDTVSDLNRRIEAICAEGACKSLDVGSVVSHGESLDKSVTTDGLHLNGAGYRRRADTIGRALGGHRR